MKTKLDHLLYCLGEECGEVQKVVSKSGRFGINNINPHNQTRNIILMDQEIHDLVAVWIMICEEVGRDSHICERRLGEKKSKVEKYMEYARSVGELMPKDFDKVTQEPAEE